MLLESTEAGEPKRPQQSSGTLQQSTVEHLVVANK